MAKVRSLFFPAIGLGALFLYGRELSASRWVDEVVGLPLPMIAFIGFTVCIVAIISKLQPRG